MSGLSFAVVGAASNQAELIYVWTQATPEAKAIIVCLILFSILAWSVMVSKAIQVRRAPNKSAFIRANHNLPVKEIIAQAAKSGVGKLTPGFCYTILSELRKRQGKVSVASKGKAAPPAGKTSQKSATSPKGVEAQFIACILELGAGRAEELFRNTLDRVRALAK